MNPDILSEGEMIAREIAKGRIVFQAKIFAPGMNAPLCYDAFIHPAIPGRPAELSEQEIALSVHRMQNDLIRQLREWNLKIQKQ